MLQPNLLNKKLIQIVARLTLPYLILLIFSTVLLSSCSTSSTIPPENVVTIATFNMEWLGDGSADDIKPRSEKELKNIARVIEMCNADIIGVEEVKNVTALNRVLKYLPGYSIQLGTRGRMQNVGVIYRNTINVNSPMEYMPVAVRGERNRPGFVVHCKKGNFDWTMMVLHLKSTSRADSTPELREESFRNRAEQAMVVSKWADSVISSGEKDVIIIGDLNDYPKRDKNPTLGSMVSNKQLVFLTDNLASCSRSGWMSIDHIVASSSSASRALRESIHHIALQPAFGKEAADGISDHCPVIGQFDVTAPDND
jgi:predicted extracellular nuclease